MSREEEKKSVSVEQRINLLNGRAQVAARTEAISNGLTGSLVGIITSFSLAIFANSELAIDSSFDSIIPTDQFTGWIVKAGLGFGFGLVTHFTLSYLLTLMGSRVTNLSSDVVAVKRVLNTDELAKDLSFSDAQKNLNDLKNLNDPAKRNFVFPLEIILLLSTVLAPVGALKKLPGATSTTIQILSISLTLRYFFIAVRNLKNYTGQKNMLLRDALLNKYFKHIANFSKLDLTLLSASPLSFNIIDKSFGVIGYDNFSNYLAFKIGGNAKYGQYERFQLEYVLKKIYKANVLAFDSSCMICELPRSGELTEDNKKEAEKLYKRRVKFLKKANSLKDNFISLLQEILEGIPDVKIKSHYVSERESKPIKDISTPSIIPIFDISIKFTEKYLNSIDRDQLLATFHGCFSATFENSEDHIYFSESRLIFEFPNSQISLSDLNEKFKSNLKAILNRQEIKKEKSPLQNSNNILYEPFEIETSKSRPRKNSGAKTKFSEKSHPNFFPLEVIKPRPCDIEIEYNEKSYKLGDANCPLLPLYHPCSNKPIAYMYWSLSEADCPNGQTLAHFMSLTKEDHPTINNQSTGRCVKQVFTQEAKRLMNAKEQIFNRNDGSSFTEKALFCKLHTGDQDRVYCFIVGQATVKSLDGKRRSINIVTARSADFSAHQGSNRKIVTAEIDGLENYHQNNNIAYQSF